MSSLKEPISFDFNMCAQEKKKRLRTNMAEKGLIY